MWISQSQAAKLPGVGVTKQRINTLVSQGRLKTNDKRQVNVQDVLRAFTKDSHPSWDEQRPAEAVPADLIADVGNKVDDESSSFRDARTRMALITAERQQFELDRQKGLYWLCADVERAQEAAGRKLRKLIEGLPMMADELFAIAQGGSAADVKKAMKEKTRTLLIGMAEAMQAAGRLADDADGA